MGNQCKTNYCDREGMLEVEHTPMDIFQKIVRIQSLIRGFLAKRQLNILKRNKHLIDKERTILIKYRFPKLSRIITPELLKNSIEIIDNDSFAYIGIVNKEGKFDGTGRLLKNDGTYTQGDFQNGELRRGTIYSDQQILQGTFQNNLLHGRGRSTNKDGAVYEGGFEKGVPNGFGRYVDLKGNVFEGQFKQGSMNGEGEYFGKDGKYYIGEWMNSQYHGKGELLYPNGQKYIGNFSHNQRHGYGELITQHGKYAGHWRDGKLYGEGLLIFEGYEIKQLNGQSFK